MTITEFWDNIGADKEQILARFVGNAPLAERCTKKYLDDKTFGEFEMAIEEKDYHKIEMAAHTLKGLAGNLGFDNIQALGQKIVSDIRADVYDSVEADFARLKAEHEKICGLINQLD